MITPFVSLQTNIASFRGDTISLQSREAECLFALCQGEFISHGDLMLALWGNRDTEWALSQIRGHVRRLRKALAPWGFEILSVHPEGYCIHHHEDDCRRVWWSKGASETLRAKQTETVSAMLAEPGMNLRHVARHFRTNPKRITKFIGVRLGYASDEYRLVSRQFYAMGKESDAA